MTKLDREPKIIQYAADLGLEWSQQPVTQIVEFCLAKIAAWMSSYPSAKSVGEIENVICQNLGLRFREVHSDEDLNKVITEYVSGGDIVFAHLNRSLDNWTFAELIERQNAVDAPDRYVAVIDCRGDEKRARSFFTRWHEIAHLLTLTPQAQPPFNRDAKERCPIERLMDVIAGEIGFYSPVFHPELAKVVDTHGSLTYKALEDLRSAYCPEASFHATAIAAVKAYDRPALLVEGRFALKAHEQRAVHSGQTFLTDEDEPKPKLRAISVMMNSAAKAKGMRIDRNMEVPIESVITRAIALGDESLVSGKENLSSWTHSGGSTLPAAKVLVEASATTERAIALILHDGDTD